MEQEIRDYIKEQKNLKLKAEIKSNMEESNKSALIKKIERNFNISFFLDYVSKNVFKLKFQTHIFKFSNPAIKGGIYLEDKMDTDGFVRVGNICTDIDISVTAMYLPIAKFLKHTLSDEKTVFEHIENGSAFFKKFFKGNGFEEFRNNILILKQSPKIKSTDNKLKQVFFPVDNESFHLLSVLTSSGLMFEATKRINKIRFLEGSKEEKKLKTKNEYSEKDFNEIYDITEIGFGGSKPQNISFLNNRNNGRACLLSSIPPTLKKEAVYPPKRDFFKETINFKSYKFMVSFLSLHNILIRNQNNFKIRNKRDAIIASIIDTIIIAVWSLRERDSGWSGQKEYSYLPEYQKIWLDSIYAEKREEEEEWADTMIEEVAVWILSSYAEIFKDKAVVLEEGEQMYIEKFIRSNREILK